VNVPLLAALRDLRRERTAGTVVLYAAIGAVMLLLVTVPLCGPMQDQLARSHHARPSTIVVWPLVQVVPKMYSFAHRTWSSAVPDDAAAPSIWVNHFPARQMRVERGREDFVERGEDRYLFVRTAYRGRRWVTRFVLRVQGGGIHVELAP
jgi:hypothetical protein